MTPIEELVAYRLQRARDTLAEAELMLQNQMYNGATNRLYYACFYAVNAILVKSGFSSSKHSGVRSLFNMHFVKKGVIDSEVSEVYNTLFSLRNDSDYDDFFSINKDVVEKLFPQVVTFIEKISNALSLR
jgi:uncharacterized protein (UPF0332 family)